MVVKLHVLCAGSVEEKIFALQDFKLKLASTVIKSLDEQMNAASYRRKEMLSTASEAIHLLGGSEGTDSSVTAEEYSIIRRSAKMRLEKEGNTMRL